MVAQAALSANAVLTNSLVSPSSTAPSALGGLPMHDRAQLAAGFLKAYKPVSPRLRPLGSPGPVTPMSLEDGGCYLTAGSSSSSGEGVDDADDEEEEEDDDDYEVQETNQGRKKKNMQLQQRMNGSRGRASV
jgi:hypothetical protein